MNNKDYYKENYLIITMSVDIVFDDSEDEDIDEIVSDDGDDIPDESSSEDESVGGDVTFESDVEDEEDEEDEEGGGEADVGDEVETGGIDQRKHSLVKEKDLNLLKLQKLKELKRKREMII